MTDRCDYSDLPRTECDHCGAHPGNAGVIAPRLAETGQGATNGLHPGSYATVILNGRENATSQSGRDLWASVPTPARDRDRQLVLVRHPEPGTCACGIPLHDNATGCPECVEEMERILGDTPWLTEQLELAITGQRAKRGAGRGDDGLPWNDAAATTLDEFRNELSTTVRVLAEEHDLAWPQDSMTAMSRWLLTNVQLLAHDDAWTDALRNLRRIEGDTLRIVDNPPARLFLGWCKAETIVGTDLTVRIEECGGPVYAREGQTMGTCRECRTEYDVEASRKALTDALDDQLVTAAEIAKLAVYLGIEQPRERIRKLVNTWHRRKRIEAQGEREGAPTFRFGKVLPLLSATFETRDEQGV